MDQQPYRALNLGINDNDLPLTPVTSTESNYSYSPVTQEDLNNTAFYYDSSLFQIYSQPNVFNIPQLPQSTLSTLQPHAQSWPSSTPHHINTTALSNVSYPRLSTFPDRIPPTAKRLSISASIHSTASTGTSSPSEPTSPHTASNPYPQPRADARSDDRKSRRRAQNRAAQRAFRARKEETIKESSVRLEILEAELERLKGRNGTLSDTVDDLRREIEQLRRENGSLRRASMDASLDRGEQLDISAMAPLTHESSREISGGVGEFPLHVPTGPAGPIPLQLSSDEDPFDAFNMDLLGTLQGAGDAVASEPAEKAEWPTGGAASRGAGTTMAAG